MQLEFAVVNQTLTWTNKELRPVENSRGYLKAHFKLPTEYNGTITALFKQMQSGTWVASQPIQVIDGSCYVPEKIIKRGSMYVSISSTDPNIHIPTNEVRIPIGASGEGDELLPTPDGKPSQYDTFEVMYNEVGEKHSEIQYQVVKTPYVDASGNWYVFDTSTNQYKDTGIKAQGPQGAKGEKGAQGIQGPKGDPGEVSQAQLDEVNTQLSQIANEQGELNTRIDNIIVTPEFTTFFKRSDKNIVDTKKIKTGGFYYYTTGNWTPSTLSTVDFTEIKPNTLYNNNMGGNICFWTDSKVYISGINSGNTTFTTPSNAKYVTIAFNPILFVPTTNKTPTIIEGADAIPTDGYPNTFALDNTLIVNPAPVIPTISDCKLTLPPTLYALEGVEFNLYFDNIVSNDASEYYWDVNLYNGDTYVDLGKQEEKRYTLTPTSGNVGTYRFLLTQRDKNYTVINDVEAVLKVVSASAKNGQTLTLLPCGDSVTAFDNSWVKQMKDLYITNGLTINTIGKYGTAPYLKQAISGWTLQNLYDDMCTDGIFDFASYMSKNGFASCDIISIHIGINDTSWMTPERVDAQWLINKAMYDTIITSAKAFNPNIKIAIDVTIPVASSQDGFGYKRLSGLTRWTAKRAIHRYSQYLIDYFKDRESEGIYLVPFNVNLDTANNYATQTVAVNARNATTVVRQIDEFHPATSGFQQLADSKFAFLKAF